MINLTHSAVKAIQRFMSDAETPMTGLRLMVSGGGCSGFQYWMRLEAKKAEDDTEIEVEGLWLFIAPFTLPMVDEINIDFIDNLTRSGFKFDNPKAAARCSCGHSCSP